MLVASVLGHAALLTVCLLVNSGRPVLEPAATETVTMEFEEAASGAPAPSSVPLPVESAAAPPASAPEPAKDPPEPVPATAKLMPPPPPEFTPPPPGPVAAPPPDLAQPPPQPVMLVPSPLPPRRSPVPDRPKHRARPPAQAEAGPAREGAPPSTSSTAGPAASAPLPAPAVQLADGWGAAIAAWLAAHKNYPAEARRRGEEGVVGVRFTVDADGRVTDIDITQPSGSAALDQATRALLAGARVPAPRIAVTRTVRLRYRLEE